LEIEDTVVLALQNPELYERIAQKTRCRYESNRPRAVLFEGPPGTGKTLSARIIAQQAGIPMIHIPIESVVSKWYGDSEKKMSSIFDACEKLDGAIIFIDEVRYWVHLCGWFCANCSAQLRLMRSLETDRVATCTKLRAEFCPCCCRKSRVSPLPRRQRLCALRTGTFLVSRNSGRILSS
jgi:hypothetical protein